VLEQVGRGGAGELVGHADKVAASSPTYDQSVTTPKSSRFSAAGLVAVLAGLVGVLLLAMAGFRVVDILGQRTEPAPSPDSTSGAAAAVTTSTAAASAIIPPQSFVAVNDDSGSILVEVPAEWGDISGSGWVVDGEHVGPAVTAAPNLDAWYSSWATPGVFVGVSATGFEPEVGNFSAVCTVGKAGQLSAGLLSGTVQAWSRCGDAGSDFYVFVGGPADASYFVLIQLVSTDGTGVRTLEQLMAAFSYLP